MKLQFEVREEEDGLLLRDFLRLKKVSAGLRSAVKRDRGFFRNGNVVYTNEHVRQNDCISFCLPPENAGSVTPQDIPLSIVYEDEQAMVLDKPVGQAVHPTLGYSDGTLANAFCGEMKRRGNQIPFRPINRIDHGTSGLVLCAMNAYAAPILAESCQKVYYAVIEGHLSCTEGVIDAPIARCRDSIVRREVAGSGKPSRTEYTVLYESERFTLVRCIPVTGRTHQIRVHFSWLGHPLVGDDFYGAKTALGRPALHCGEVTFSVFRQVHIRRRLPRDMQSLFFETANLERENWLFDAHDL